MGWETLEVEAACKIHLAHAQQNHSTQDISPCPNYSSKPEVAKCLVMILEIREMNWLCTQAHE